MFWPQVLHYIPRGRGVQLWPKHSVWQVTAGSKHEPMTNVSTWGGPRIQYMAFDSMYSILFISYNFFMYFISKMKNLRGDRGAFLIMFTVSGRVINELVELTCAINFSLLFRFVAPLEKKHKRQCFYGGWREEERRKERDRGRRYFNKNNSAFNLHLIITTPHPE